jgi:acetate---CoA ligase (ADP-forming)
MPPFASKGLGFVCKGEAGAVRLGLTTLVVEVEMLGANGYLPEERVRDAVAGLLIGFRRDPDHRGTSTWAWGPHGRASGRWGGVGLAGWR